MQTKRNKQDGMQILSWLEWKYVNCMVLLILILIEIICVVFLGGMEEEHYEILNFDHI